MRIVFQLLPCGIDIQGRWHGITEGLTQWKCRKIPTITETESGIGFSPSSSAMDKRSKRSIGELKTPVNKDAGKFHTPPLCFAQQNIRVVSHSDGGVSSTEMSENIREIPARRRVQILQSIPMHSPYATDLSRFVISQKRSSATPSHLTILPKRIKKPSDKNRTVEISIRFKY